MRAFTNYLPGFNIPMLPRELSDDLCSLRANEVRPVLACRMTTAADGTIEDNIEFFAATIESKAKLAYDDVSDWLEGRGSWQPDSEAIAQQITLLKDVCQRRSEWRQTHALVFKDRPDYRFVLGEKRRSAGYRRGTASHCQPHCRRVDDRRQHLCRPRSARQARLRRL